MTIEQVLTQTLHPIVLAVPDRIQGRQGRRQVQALGRLARAAARQSARLMGGRLVSLDKNAAGAPLPSNGWYWSVTHKPAYVAGIVSPEPVGIDIEPLRRRSPRLLTRIADETEWRLGREDEWQLFYRFWTAKEAVLKAVGVGMRGLSGCRVVRIDGAFEMTLAHGCRLWTVRQSSRHGHWAAVALQDGAVEWHWPGGAC